jgi:hypothetical protein
MNIFSYYLLLTSYSIFNLPAIQVVAYRAGADLSEAVLLAYVFELDGDVAHVEKLV